MKEKILLVVVGILLILNISNYFEIKKLNEKSAINKNESKSELPPRFLDYDKFYFDENSQNWIRYGYDRRSMDTTKIKGKLTFSRPSKSKYYYFSELHKNWKEISQSEYITMKSITDDPKSNVDYKTLVDYNDDIYATYFLWDKRNNKWVMITKESFDKYYKLDSIVRFEI